MGFLREIVVTDDPVLVSFIETLFNEAGITLEVFDRNMSALTGAAGKLPQRVMVDPDQWARARRLLVDAGLEQWIIEAGDG